MSVRKANTTALSMLDAKILMEDTVVNVSQDLRETERSVSVCSVHRPLSLGLIWHLKC